MSEPNCPRSSTTLCQDFGLLLVRFGVGVVMMFHGSQKLFEQFGGSGMEAFTANVKTLVNDPLGLPEFISPEVLAYAAAGSEFGGGALLILGLLTRLAALAVGLTMIGAVIFFHGPDYQELFQNGTLPNKADFPLLIALVALGLMFLGPGRMAIDKLLFGREKEDEDEAPAVAKSAASQPARR